MPKAVKGTAAVKEKAKQLKTLKVEEFCILDVQPNSYNPNRQSEHDFALLLRSIREDGFTQPIVCVRISQEMLDERAEDGRPDPALHNPDGTPRFKVDDIVIVDGEHRWRAIRELALEADPNVDLRTVMVPATIVPMGLTQARIATLRHNRARGSEDVQLAADVVCDLVELGAADWAQESLMMDDEEMQRLLEDIPAPEALADEEYKQAWAPTPGSAGNDNTEATNLGDRVSSASTRAADAQRSIEKRIASARTEEERQMIAMDSKTYRIVCAFVDDEARLVEHVLGKTPAQRLLELCQQDPIGVEFTAQATTETATPEATS